MVVEGGRGGVQGRRTERQLDGRSITIHIPPIWEYLRTKIRQIDFFPRVGDDGEAGGRRGGAEA